MEAALSPQEFVERWRNTDLGERQSYQAHFMDVCRMVGYETPTGTGKDSQGNNFVFEPSLKKQSGGQGFADVFLQKHFAFEYKAANKYKDLRAAYDQLLQYREQLENPPLLVVTDIKTWEIHTNWPNTEKKIYRFSHEEIASRTVVRDYLRHLFYDPQKLHPRRNSEQVTAEAAKAFELIANNMRDWQADPQRIAHFLTKLVFCLFAEDVSLLPSGPKGDAGIFSEIIEQTRNDTSRFVRYADELFRAMADGGDVLFQRIPYFNGSLFVDVRVEELAFEALSELEKASHLNWESVEPAIFGTLFERSLDPAKRSQLGAHYTSREDILLIVEPVLMRPLERQWEAIKLKAAPIRAKYDEALLTSNRREQTTYAKQLEDLRGEILHSLREIKVLDPACGSGNFLYVALQRLMDMEKEVLFHALFEGLTRPFPEVHPSQMYGIEKEPIAHALASIVVWIGYLQWRRTNGYLTHPKEPILQDIHENIQNMDAILAYTASPIPPSAAKSAVENLPLRSGGTEGGISGERFREGINTDEESLSLQSGGTEGGISGETEGGTRFANTRISLEIWAKLKPLVRDMRKEPTPAEELLWQKLRKKQLGGYKFRRQHPIGYFIADFYCADARLVIEVDGGIHEQQKEYDELRQAYIESLGLRVLRFENAHVIQTMQGVLERIAETLETPFLSFKPEIASPIPSPSPDSQGKGVSEESTESPSLRSGEGFREGMSVDEPSSSLNWDEFHGGIFAPAPNPSPASQVQGVKDDSNAVESLPLRSGGTEGGTSGERFREGIAVTPTEPEWPTVDVIIGNPPFLGGSKMLGELGEPYQKDLWKVYSGRIAGGADLVTYWFEKARKHIADGKAKRAGLLSTNSIRGGVNRDVLNRIKETGDIFMAWGDRAWTLDGASVRVSMVGFDNGSEKEKELDGQSVVIINPDLTGKVDITIAQQLKENLGICFIGTKKAGAFDIDKKLAYEMLESVNKSGKNNSDVISLWINGTAIVRHSDEKWIINFGDMPESEAMLYEKPFEYIKKHVYPDRQSNNEQRARDQWWLHRRPAMDMMTAKATQTRFIATSRISKYRIFRWYPSNITPDDGTYIFARDDDYFFGVLHSQLHEIWSLRMGTWLGVGNDPRYTPTTTFETFPFPFVPKTEDPTNAAYQAIAAAAQQLHEERHAWLNPPSLRSGEGLGVGTSGERFREGKSGEGLGVGVNSAAQLKDRTLTNLYNALNVFRGKEKMKIKEAAGNFAPRLDELHSALDTAVCAAYGWPTSILNDEEAILGHLLALNLERAAK